MRWYITPGTASTYDLQVHNDTDRAVLCRVTVASHLETASVKPQSLTLQAHETRTVAVTFGADAQLPRDRKAVITVKDAAGQTLSTIERELVSGASTDATLVLSWKEPIVEEGVLRGFILYCNIRSLSGTADDFTPDFTAHPALTFPKHEPVWLEPGATAMLELPIRWDRAKRDNEGWNHPRAIEASVAVSQGRRSTRMVWDVVQRAAGDLLDRADKSPFVERRASAPAFVPSAAPQPAANTDAPKPSAERTPAERIPAEAADVSRPAVAAQISKNGVAKAAETPAKDSAPAKDAAVSKDSAPAKNAASAKTSAAASDAAPTNGSAPAKDAAQRNDSIEKKDSGQQQVAAPTQVAVPPQAAAQQSDAPQSLVMALPLELPASAPQPAEIAASAAPPAPPPSPAPTTPLEQRISDYREDMRPAPAVEHADVHKSVRDIKSDVEKNFEGYHPAFQMGAVTAAAVRPQTGLSLHDDPAHASTGSLVAGDLDGSVVITGSHSIYHPITTQPEKPKVPIGRGSLWVAGGVVALALIVLISRPHAPTDTAQVSAPAAVAAAPAAAPASQSDSKPVVGQASLAHKSQPARSNSANAKAKSATPVKVAPSAAPVPTPAVQATAKPVAQTKPVQASPATAAPGSFAVLSPRAIARKVAPRPAPIDRSALPEIDSVDATYTRLGRAVVIAWASYAQANAAVQLTDARGTLIAQGGVRGMRSRLLLPLPRGYHGDVYVQVSVTGFHDERVVQTSSLPPF
ncbi:MAG TPA: hypothetical protein VKT51_11210 [Candidatus Eremiobacteraceae bacterium]|nr:hypothetical protein [Candidatus Eremiobacteraceae bacterium]